MGQKLSSKLLFIYSSNSDGFYIFHISQGSVATQLRCGGMFGNHFITNFPQNAPMKKVWESVNISQRYGQNFVAYFFGPPCIYFRHNENIMLHDFALRNLRICNKTFQSVIMSLSINSRSIIANTLLCIMKLLAAYVCIIH